MKEFFFKCQLLFIFVLFPIINCSQMTQSDRDKCRNGVEPQDNQIIPKPQGTKAGDVSFFCQFLPLIQIFPVSSPSDKKFTKQEMDLLLAACVTATKRLRHCDRKSDLPNLDLTRADE